MGYASAEHDRMIAAMVKPCVVVGIDLMAGPVSYTHLTLPTNREV